MAPFCVDDGVHSRRRTLPSLYVGGKCRRNPKEEGGDLGDLCVGIESGGEFVTLLRSGHFGGISAYLAVKNALFSHGKQEGSQYRYFFLHFSSALPFFFVARRCSLLSLSLVRGEFVCVHTTILNVHCKVEKCLLCKHIEFRALNLADC